MPVDQLAPRDVPPQQEPQHNSLEYLPQEEEPFEIVVMVLEARDTQEAMAEDQHLPQNDGNNDNSNNTDNINNHENHDNGNNNENDNNSEGEDEDDEDYTPLSDFEKEEMYHEDKEIKTTRNEALIPTDRLWDLLSHINITTAPEFRIKRVSRSGWEEYMAVVEILSGPNVIRKHMGPAFRVTYKDAVVDAGWQAITAYNHTHHDKPKNSINHHLPQRKKDKFKTSRVRADVPRMVMIHHQDVSMEMNIHL
jgi:hypothetical protein